MMSNPIDNGGGFAFPVIAENGLGHIDSGMTLRDYFAAKAMQGLIANPEDGTDYDEEAVAKNSYKMADAMLCAREPK